MKKNIRHFFMIATLIFALLTVTACDKTSGNNDTSGNVSNDIINDVSNNAPNNDLSAGREKKQTLVISQWIDIFGLGVAIEKFKAIHPDVEIVLQTSDGDLTKHIQQTKTRLMAGDGADILEATGLRDIKIYDSGLLTDFYTLMKNDPDFNEDDYYMNVFEGMAYNDKLFVFPNAFRYDVIGVNNKFSEAFAQRFKQYDTITYRPILDLYNSLADKGNRYLSYNIDSVTAINSNLMTFIDFKSRTCNFNSADFAKFITDLKNSTNPQKIGAGELGDANYGQEEQEEYALKYLFKDADSAQYSVFLPYTDKKAFTHFVPTIDEKGNLMIVPFKSLCISEKSENKELAWEFIKFLTTPEASQDTGVRIAGFPVHREFFKTYVSAGLAQSIDNRRLIEAIDGETADIVKQVMALFEQYNEMPMKYQVIFSTGGGVAYDAIVEIMTSFYNGILTAEQAASELQNKISLYLLE